MHIPDGPKDKMVTQAAFWPMMGQFLREDDIVVAETGTSSFGMIGTPLPKGATFVSQVLWGSIGWAGGSTLGALLAAEESPKPRRGGGFPGGGGGLWGGGGGGPGGGGGGGKAPPKPRRVVVFTGEGSLQLTAQEVSTMVRLNLKPILVVLNNDGYVSPASF